MAGNRCYAASPCICPLQRFAGACRSGVPISHCHRSDTLKTPGLCPSCYRRGFVLYVPPSLIFTGQGGILISGMYSVSLAHSMLTLYIPGQSPLIAQPVSVSNLLKSFSPPSPLPSPRTLDVLSRPHIRLLDVSSECAQSHVLDVLSRVSVCFVFHFLCEGCALCSLTTRVLTQPVTTSRRPDPLLCPSSSPCKFTLAATLVL